VRLSGAGSYCGCIEGFVPLDLGSRITVRLGEAPCRLDIDPGAIQVWPRDQSRLHTG
jgi:hypothetical protein